jgi:hypothetical protein
MIIKLPVQHPLVLALSFVLLGLTALGQVEPQRINVRAGGPARITKGEIRDRVEVVYVFKGRSGQKFSGRIKRHSGDASFAVTDPDGEALPEEEFDVNTNLKGSLKKNGDYKITVNTVNTQNSTYSLSVRLY